MPHSESEQEAVVPGQGLAVAAEALYLLNLLLFPGLAFVVLLLLYAVTRASAPPLAACHLSQALSASLWAGVVLILINGAIIAFGGYEAPWTWVVVVLYFTICHAALVLLGILGLAKAMAAKGYRYPLVGRPCPGLL